MNTCTHAYPQPARPSRPHTTPSRPADGEPIITTGQQLDEALSGPSGSGRGGGERSTVPIVAIYGLYHLPKPTGPVLVVISEVEVVLHSKPHGIQYERATRIELLPVLRRPRSHGVGDKADRDTHTPAHTSTGGRRQSALDMLCGSLTVRTRDQA